MPSLAFLPRLFVLLTLVLTGPAVLADVAKPVPDSIRVVLDDNYPPYSFRDGNGQPQGLLKDLWTLWQERTGIAVDFLPMEWGKARATMEGGRADVIDTIFRTADREKLYEFSAPYATLEVALFFHQSISGIADAESAKGFSIAVKEGDACVEYLNAQGVVDLKPYASYQAQIDAAARNEARVFASTSRPRFIYFSARASPTSFDIRRRSSSGNFIGR